MALARRGRILSPPQVLGLTGLPGEGPWGPANSISTLPVLLFQGEVTIHYNKLQADPKQGMSLDIGKLGQSSGVRWLHEPQTLVVSSHGFSDQARPWGQGPPRVPSLQLFLRTCPWFLIAPCFTPTSPPPLTLGPCCPRIVLCRPALQLTAAQVFTLLTGRAPQSQPGTRPTCTLPLHPGHFSHRLLPGKLKV